MESGTKESRRCCVKLEPHAHKPVHSHSRIGSCVSFQTQQHIRKTNCTNFQDVGNLPFVIIAIRIGYKLQRLLHQHYYPPWLAPLVMLLNWLLVLANDMKLDRAACPSLLLAQFNFMLKS